MLIDVGARRTMQLRVRCIQAAVATGCAVLLFLAAVTAQERETVVSGEPSAGKVVYEGKGECSRCHAIDNRGGSLGPELGWIGVLRSSESLRRSLTDPNDQVDPRFHVVIAETKKGEAVEGVVLNQDSLSIQLRDTQRQLRSILRGDLKSVRQEARSLMPSYASRLSSAEIDDVVAYLRSLRTMWKIESLGRTRPIPRYSTNVGFFDRPGRDAEERTDELIQALEIDAGAVVADIGSGTGYFTWRLAREVGEGGKVIAVDIQKPMLDLTADEINRRQLRNVEYILARPRDPGLSDNSLDLAFVGYAYHEFAEPDATLAAIRRALKPSGRLVILEYATESPFAPASALHKMSLSDLRSEIEPLGFVIDRLLDFLPMQHCIIFVKG